MFNLLEFSTTWKIAEKQAKIDFPELNFWCPKEMSKYSKKRVQLEKEKGITAIIVANKIESENKNIDSESFYIYYVNHKTQSATLYKHTSEYSEVIKALNQTYKI